MYYVYLLKDRIGRIYIGYSANLRRRVKEHKLGKVYTSRRMNNATLIYYEAYDSDTAAKLREKKLKQFGSSYKGLIKRLNIP